MKKRMILPIILIFFTIVGCKENPVISEPVKTEPLIPLSLGNYWLYREYYLNSDGTGGRPSIFKLGNIIDDTVTQIINGERIINYKLFICDSTLRPSYDKPGNFEGSKLIYHRKEGIYYAGTEKYDTIITSFNDLIFLYPAEKGDSMSGHIFYYTIGGNAFNIPDEAISQYICVSTDSLFSTEVGEFRCIVYKMPYYDLKPLFRDEVFYFIKSGLGIVGMVKMVFHYNTKEYTYVSKTLLTDYKIKKGQ